MLKIRSGSFANWHPFFVMVLVPLVMIQNSINANFGACQYCDMYVIVL